MRGSRAGCGADHQRHRRALGGKSAVGRGPMPLLGPLTRATVLSSGPLTLPRLGMELQCNFRDKSHCNSKIKRWISGKLRQRVGN
jgi:hypothetical protein